MKNFLYFWEDLHPVIKALIWAIVLIILWIIAMAYLGYGEPAKADPRDTCEVQRTLAQKGLYDGEIDCIYGPGTREAVARFQRLVGLPDDGLVGSDTLEALFGRHERPETPAADEYKPERNRRDYDRPSDRAELGQCGELIAVKGGIKTTTWWATRAAIAAWRTQVSDRYGNKYVNWDKAQEKAVDCEPACANCTVRFECSARGMPCR
jgi:hypothetical protein